MIPISKEEKVVITTSLPNAHIVPINRQKKSKRKKFYVDEVKEVKELLKKLRK